MTAWIAAGIRAGLQGCVLAAAVLLLVASVRRLSPAVRCRLWWLVLAEFAVGWLCTVPIRIQGPAPLAGAVQTIQGTAQRVARRSESPALPAEPAPDATWIIVALWALGAFVSLCSTATGTLRMLQVRRAAVDASPEVQGEARRISAELGLPAPPPVLVSKGVHSPAAYGAVKPCILVPESFPELPAAEREMVLTHELAHILRHDGLFGLVPQMARAVFWFFPVVHLVRREWAGERELACDALVYERPTVQVRDYRRLLLRIVEGDVKPLPRNALGATADFRCLRRRLMAAPSAAGPLAKAAGLAAVLCIGILAVPVSFQTRSPGGGLLKNAGFEEGSVFPVGWQTGGRLDQVQYIWDDRVSHTGRRSIGIRKTADNYFPIAQWSQTVPYDGKSHGIEFSGWVKADRMYKAVLDVQFAGDEGISTHAWVAYVGAKKLTDPPATHEWKRIGGAARIPAGTKQIILALQDYGPGRVWMDDVSARLLPSAPKANFRP